MENFEELPELLSDINTPFKISAGPGAGKTTWLVNHVQNVLKNSDKLNKTQKIGCITYTRIGADTVEKKVIKLSGTSRIEIGTIHSFLYHNVIKPFSYLIEKDDNGNELFTIQELSGHIENRPNYDRVSSWVQSIGTKYKYLCDNKKKDKDGLTNLFKTFKLLQEFEWIYENSVVSSRLRKIFYRDYPFPSTKIYEYKLANWRKGIMHHEDVLYFTHLIFNKKPRIVEFLSNKFPYLFLDEFQDTTPLQTWIINEISKHGTIVGVIGDPAQSIFEFAGARRKDFNDFILPEIKFFKKSHNYRSTQRIIDFLKYLRDDIQQKPKEGALLGEEIILLVGDADKAIEYVKGLGENDFAVLCRYNKDVNRLKRNLRVITGENLLDLLYSEDTNYKRPVFIHSLVKSYDFYENGEFKEAIKELMKYLRTVNVSKIEKRKVAIEIIEYLKCNLDVPIADIYKHWQNIFKNEYSIDTLIGLQKTKEIHNSIFRDFLPFLSKQTKISSKIRTIHQAKGDEFKNVLVCLFDKTDRNGKVNKKLENILSDYIFNATSNINIDSDIGEETRLLYVAFSRAKERLYINVPKLSAEEEVKMKGWGLIIEKIPTDNML